MFVNKLGDLLQQLRRLWDVLKPHFYLRTRWPTECFHLGIRRQLYLFIHTSKCELFACLECSSSLVVLTRTYYSVHLRDLLHDVQVSAETCSPLSRSRGYLLVV